MGFEVEEEEDTRVVTGFTPARGSGGFSGGHPGPLPLRLLLLCLWSVWGGPPAAARFTLSSELRQGLAPDAHKGGCFAPPSPH
ncbi:Hypothetical predicted protein [Lynx pardinus]|uniref:Uncharacterized protein n=1 Tax=Lynx pardinus TaxID=191816 RepID=A0A485N972_LYNPA|nr:Hypothetical predicted protein [Lynx pardinus]